MISRLSVVILNSLLLVQLAQAQFGGEYPDPCDSDAAAACEYDFLQCRLFTGPADDPTTMCNCGEVGFVRVFYLETILIDQLFIRLTSVSVSAKPDAHSAGSWIDYQQMTYMRRFAWIT